MRFRNGCGTRGVTKSKKFWISRTIKIKIDDVIFALVIVILSILLTGLVVWTFEKLEERYKVHSLL